MSLELTIVMLIASWLAVASIDRLNQVLDDVQHGIGTLAKFINDNPTVVMLALGFLIMIGMTLIAEGFGAHVPKGYIYAAMAFSAAVEALNMLVRRARRKKAVNQVSTH